MRRNKTIIIVVVSIFVCIFGILLTFFLTRSADNKKMEEMEADYQTQLAAKQSEIDSTIRTVYTPITAIKCGEEITLDKLQPNTTYHSDLPQEYFLTDAEIGGIAKTDFEANVPICKSMIASKDVTGKLETEINFLNIMSNVTSNDYVDIRVKFADGTDYIVLAKQQLKDLDANSTNCFLDLTEDQLLRLNSAVVDSAATQAKLYVTRYTEPSIQDAFIETYHPNLHIIRLIAEDPNVIDEAKLALTGEQEKRTSFEKRLKNFKALQNPDDLTLGEVTGSRNAGSTAGAEGDAAGAATSGTTDGSTDATVDDTAAAADTTVE